MDIFQPTIASGNEAGVVEDNANMNGFADVARVAIHNWHVAPYIHTGGGVTEAVRSYRDPVVGEWVRKSGIATGVTHGLVFRTGVFIPDHPAFGTLRNQVLATFHAERGDSGSPVYRPLPTGGVEILGILWGESKYEGVWYRAFSPVSGVETELPGWFVHTK